MKKLISLILVVLLCLPAVYIPVSAAGADTFTVTAADGADKTSDDYLNIYKYLAYYDGGDVINIPEKYITVGQWKANIKNPSINAGELADADYITGDCTFTLTMDDGVTTKQVSAEIADSNYFLLAYDKKQSTTFDSNSIGLSTGKGSKATLTKSVEEISEGVYGLGFNIATASDATSTQGYANIIQNLANINAKNLPYVLTYKFDIDSAESLFRLSTGFMNSKNNGRSIYDLPAATSELVKASGTIKVDVVVFPEASLMDIYVNDAVVKANFSTTDNKNGTSYTDYVKFFLRFYNGTKVGGVYKDFTATLTDYEVRYGYGKFNAPVYVKPEISITNYTDGEKVKVADVKNILASTNVDNYTSAELYVNGTKVRTENIVSKSVSFSSSYLTVGENEVEVIMYKNGKNPVSTGKINVTVEGSVKIADLTDGMLLHPDNFMGIIKAVVDADGYKRAELYIDGALIEEINVSGKEIFFSAATPELGKRTIEVKVYPAKGECISSKITVNFSDLTASEIFEFKGAEGVDKASDAYKNITKYFAYLDGEYVSVPANYITVGQWKANVANPAIVAENLLDTDYITNDCTLVWTAADGITTKTLYFDVAQYNYLYEKYDNTKEIDVINSSRNNLNIYIGGGTNGKVSTTNKDMGDGTYVINSTLDSFTTTADPYAQIVQNFADINKNIKTPYMVDMELKFSDASGYSSANLLLRGATGTVYDGKQRANIAVTGFKGKVQSGNTFRFTVVFYPEADLADIYLDGSLVKENFNLVFTDDLGTSTYDNCSSFALRFFNKTKVNGEFAKLEYEISRYEIKYGFGTINEEVYVAPTVDIVNYKDGVSYKTDEIVDLEVVTNTDDVKTAALFVDGVKVAEEAVVNKTAVFDMSQMGFGEHEVEVRMYPEIGEYVSETISVSVKNPEFGTEFVMSFDDMEAGKVPANISKPVENIVAVNFVNMNQPGLNDPSATAADALVEYYDEARGNVMHAKAAEDSNTALTGRRIEFNLEPAYDAVMTFDFMFKEYVTWANFVSVRHYVSDKAGEYGFIKVKNDGTIVVNGSDLTKVELDKWYKMEVFAYANMGESYVVNIFDENGGLIASDEGVVPNMVDVDIMRIYTQYDSKKKGDIYLDDVKMSIIKSSGSISSSQAVGDNMLKFFLSNVTSVENVEIANSKGNVKLLGYSYDVGTNELIVTTAVPLENNGEYHVSVYPAGYTTPLTKGVVIETGVSVKDSFFEIKKGKSYVVLEASNCADTDDEMTVIISQWDGSKLVSTRAEKVVVKAGEDKYRVQITENIDNVKIMPVKSLSKPILLSRNVLTK